MDDDYEGGAFCSMPERWRRGEPLIPSPELEKKLLALLNGRKPKQERDDGESIQQRSISQTLPSDGEGASSNLG